MARATTLTTSSDRAVVVKRASGIDAPALAAEAARLRAAAHPGVVEVASSGGSEEGWELALVHAGRPLSAVGALPVEQVAGIAAAVAATLADLHDAGIVHGRLDLSHVLLGPHGRPVLCGFGDGATPASPADDVAAVGVLIGELLQGAEELEPIPERRWHRRPHWSGWTRRSLLTIADQACAEPPTRRPSARRLAAAIAEAVPGASTVPSPDVQHRQEEDRSIAASPSADDDPLHLLRRTAQYDGGSPRHLVAGLCALVGAVLVAVGGLHLGARTPAAPALDPVAPPPIVTTSTTRRARVEGNLVVHGPNHFEVGRAGDVVVVGDWDCDGTATPAVLRPTTGEVFIFPSWTTGADVVVRAQTVVPGAVDLVAKPTPGEATGCATLFARRDDSTAVSVTVGPP